MVTRIGCRVCVSHKTGRCWQAVEMTDVSRFCFRPFVAVLHARQLAASGDRSAPLVRYGICTQVH